MITGGTLLDEKLFSVDMEIRRVKFRMKDTISLEFGVSPAESKMPTNGASR